LIVKHAVNRVGFGFGGPIDATGLRTVKSHQVNGWDDFPLAEWCQRELGLPAVLGNDADLGGLAEAHYGAGRNYNPIFYITVGTGIGGGFIVDRHVYRGGGHGAAELGHLRPGVKATDPHDTLESHAAGPGIAATMRRRLAQLPSTDDRNARDLVARCGGNLELLTAKIVGEAASAGNQLAMVSLQESLRVLGWAIAQMITILAPAAVLIGGGVSLMGEELFFVPVCREVERYVFPPFRGTYRIMPAQLGEEMVVHGALALAANADNITPNVKGRMTHY
jgi:glucokinase